MAEKKNKPPKQQASTYTISDVFKITDELFKLSKENKYPPGAFVHGLIFTLEFAQQSYNIPQQHLAEIKRDCRRYVQEIVRAEAKRLSSEPVIKKEK